MTVSVHYLEQPAVTDLPTTPAGELLRVAIALNAGTSVRQLVDELKRTNAELQSLDQLKTNFLSNLSHELRTPLSVVLSYLHALEDEVAGGVTSLQHQYLREAIGGADRLRTLLNELFDFTELESGVLTLDRIEVDLGAIAQDIADETKPSLDEAGLTFTWSVPQDPVCIAADPPRIAQVLRALKDNARKFTPLPGMWSSASVKIPSARGWRSETPGSGLHPKTSAASSTSSFRLKAALLERTEERAWGFRSPRPSPRRTAVRSSCKASRAQARRFR